jgi:hypothetical protein
MAIRIHNETAMNILKSDNNSIFQFNKDIEQDILIAKQYVESLNRNVCNNVFLICHALYSTRNLNGCYLECGVFRGSTILTAKKFCDINSIDRRFIGTDTFTGFPANQITNQYDKPAQFAKLYKQNKISKDHFDATKKRIANLETKHLDVSYFSDIDKTIFDLAQENNIELLNGPFDKILTNIDIPIAVMHIDCDLYEPYLECLNLQYKNVVSGGVIVFDEYYSHKYPGARIAVDQFLSTLNSDEYVLLKFRTDDFERWCLIKS